MYEPKYIYINLKYVTLKPKIQVAVYIELDSKNICKKNALPTFAPANSKFKLITKIFLSCDRKSKQQNNATLYCVSFSSVSNNIF